jgi:predicted transcriptional regulator
MSLTTDEDMSIAQEVVESLIDMGLVAVTEDDHYCITEKGEHVLQRQLWALRREARELQEERHATHLHGVPNPM